MKLSLNDRTLFGNDAGEDEDVSILVSYFVEQPAFADFLDASVRLQVAKGRKGTGKSALLVRFEHALRADASKPVVLHATPSDLAALCPPPDTDNWVVLENYWKQVICSAINMRLARHVGFAWNDDQIALVESAEVSGFIGKDLVGALLSRLTAKVKLGAFEIARAPQPAASHQELLKRLASHRQVPVWFLLDDLDTKYQNTASQQAYVSSFFSACRYLVREIKGIGIRATIRPDVWTSLSHAEDLDKFDQYLTDIAWSATQQQNMLAQRILAFVKRTEPDSDVAMAWTSNTNADALIGLVFERRMRWGSASAPASQVLRVLAGGRPRWMTQLCRLAGTHAVRAEADLIGKQHLDQAMGEFGRRRLADVYKEHAYQFSDLQKLVEAFSGGARRYTTAELCQKIAERYVEVVRPGAIPIVDGMVYGDIWQLAHFLFKVGFINGFNDQATLDVQEFVSYEQRPDLLQVGTNLDDGMAWEIQPAYRNILRIR